MNTLVTHNGVFHADEVMATAILLNVFPTIGVIRTRNPQIIEEADIVYDVGGTYDHERKRYDHHQRGGAGVRDNGVPYSSAGLIWKHFGQEYLAKAGYESKFLGELLAAVDEELIQGIDATDCGYLQSTSNVRVQSLSSIVSGYNPNWLEEDVDVDERFLEAIQIASTVLTNVCKNIYGRIFAHDQVLRSEIVMERILVLDRFLPWQEAVVRNMRDICFVIFPDVSGSWRVQTVPKELGQFGSRKDLPAEWAGLNGKDLQDITGVDDAIFCHNGRFIAGAQTREGAMKLARLAL